MLIDTKNSKNATVKWLPQEAVDWDGGFWKERFDVCADVTVPHIRALFEDPNPIFHVVENFRIAAGRKEGSHFGTPFADGDFYKWMEAAMYVAAKRGDKKLEAELDGYIELIGAAQQPDGYLSTKQIIADKQGGNSRLGDILDFEVYNFGHLFTAACLYKRIFGKDNFLRIAEKTADYLKAVYEGYLAKGKAQTEVCPSHYMGIIELYRTTGKPGYLTLAEQALAVRDLVENGSDDNQDAIPLRTHRKIVGHGVRSTYLYAGVADVYAENGDADFKEVLDACWKNCVEKKLYINGGCGALYNGISPYGLFPRRNDFKMYTVHQAFGYEYQLPNVTAYNESCATLGNIMWSLRMFAHDPSAKYFDIIERSMYNLTVAAVDLEGKKFFYENMLRRTKGLDFEVIWGDSRTDDLSSFCCPPNVARVIAQSSEYAYMITEDAVWTGMYGASHAAVRLPNGAAFTLRQETDYPWDGTIRFTFDDVLSDQPFVLRLRIPGWTASGTVRYNGKTLFHLDASSACSYLDVPVSDLKNAEVELVLDMPVRLTVAHTMLEEDVNQAAVERGPIVYCVEAVDAPGVEDLMHLLLPTGARFAEKICDVVGNRMLCLETEMLTPERGAPYSADALYQTLNTAGFRKVPVRLIPYYAWDNRERGEMTIWLPVFWGKSE